MVLLMTHAAVAFQAPAVHTKPVQVFIMMGQSNMLGEGKIHGADKNGTLEYAVKTEHKYAYLWNTSSGAWATSPNVRNVFIMGSGNQSFEASKLQHNEFMTAGVGTTIGPELGIGFTLSNFTDAPVMTLKSCIGDRVLGWDLLPPGSESFDYNDSKTVWTYAGYHQSPARWLKGTTPKPIGWMAGEQYDGDTNRSSIILTNLDTYYPGASGYEVAGFFWWQAGAPLRLATPVNRTSRTHL